MSDSVSGPSTAIVLDGGHPGLAGPLTAAIAGYGIAVRSAEAREHPGDADIVVLVLDETRETSMFTGHQVWSSRCRMRLRYNAVCDAAVSLALHTGPRHLLAVCDARHLSYGQRFRALRWLRDLLQRIRYECAMNGLHDLVTHYSLIDRPADIERAADAAVALMGAPSPAP